VILWLLYSPLFAEAGVSILDWMCRGGKPYLTNTKDKVETTCNRFKWREVARGFLHSMAERFGIGGRSGLWLVLSYCTRAGDTARELLDMMNGSAA